MYKLRTSHLQIPGGMNMQERCYLCKLPIALGFGPRPAGYCKCPIYVTKKPPCDCGNENASWHGDEQAQKLIRAAIAAAPGMLEALEKIAEIGRQKGDARPQDAVSCFLIAEEAIKAAKGEV